MKQNSRVDYKTQNLDLLPTSDKFYSVQKTNDQKSNMQGSSPSTSTSPSDCNSPNGSKITVTSNQHINVSNPNTGKICVNIEHNFKNPIYQFTSSSNLPSASLSNAKPNAANYNNLGLIGNGANSPIIRRHTRQWTREEDNRLCEATKILGTQSWQAVAMYVGNGRNQSQCSQRWQRVLDPKIKKTTWTESEDQKLLKFVNEFGTQRWMRISNEFGNRSDVQCRYRYYQLLKKKSRKLISNRGGYNNFESPKIVNNNEMNLSRNDDYNLHNDAKSVLGGLYDFRNQENQFNDQQSLIESQYNQKYSLINLMNSNAQVKEEKINELRVRMPSNDGNIIECNSLINQTKKSEDRQKISLPSISIFLEDPKCVQPKKQLFA